MIHSYLNFLVVIVVFLMTMTLSWITLRVAQDLYHIILGHNWFKIPLFKIFHQWHMESHHRIYGKEYKLRVPETELAKAHWYNEVPEAICMLLCVLILMLVLNLMKFPDWWATTYGVYNTSRFHLVRAIRIGLGDTGFWYTVTQEHQEASLARANGYFTESPGFWKVNALYHLNHHDESPNTHFSAAFPWVDWAFGTAHNWKNKTFTIVHADCNTQNAHAFAKALDLKTNKLNLISI
jgi:monoglucosyldiacylglycerol epimerase